MLCSLNFDALAAVCVCVLCGCVCVCVCVCMCVNLKPVSLEKTGIKIKKPVG